MHHGKSEEKFLFYWKLKTGNNINSSSDLMINAYAWLVTHKTLQKLKKHIHQSIAVHESGKCSNLNWPLNFRRVSEIIVTAGPHTYIFGCKWMIYFSPDFTKKLVSSKTTISILNHIYILHKFIYNLIPFYLCRTTNCRVTPCKTRVLRDNKNL